MKSVLVVGAGPAGLVTAKTLLQANPDFKVTVLEQRHRVGGMWGLERPASETSTEEQGWEKCSPEMRTNLSRFTVSFSDFSWESVELEPGKILGREELPMFPRAWQVGRYLQSYAKEYIPDGVISFGCKVTSAEKVQSQRGSKWKVEWTAPSSFDPAGVDKRRGSRKDGVSNNDIIQPQNPATPEVAGTSDVAKLVKNGATFYQGTFDYLVVTSGFFHEPRTPDFAIPSDSKDQSSLSTKIIHSSTFRHVHNLVSDSAKGKIVVIGGGMSGSETAAAIAAQISDSKYAPNSTKSLENISLHHVATRPFYPLPRHLPQSPKSQDGQSWNAAPSFAPLDLCMYDLGRRPAGPIFASSGRMTADKAKKAHQYLHSLVGDDRSDPRLEELVHSEKDFELPAFVGITDTYAASVRSGEIIPVKGRVTALNASKTQEGEDEELKQETVTVRINTHVKKISSQRPSPHQTSHASQDATLAEETDDSSDEIPAKDLSIQDVLAVVYANGFTSYPAISWLSKEIRETMECNDMCHRLPLLLQRNCVCHDAIPNLGFVGYYEGPFWGVMEMQARYITRKWSADGQVSQEQNMIEMCMNPPVRSFSNINDLFGVQQSKTTDIHRREGDDSANEELNGIRLLRTAILQHLPDIPQFWMGDYVGVVEGFARDLKIHRDDARWGGERAGPCVGARYVPSSTQSSLEESNSVSSEKTTDTSDHSTANSDTERNKSSQSTSISGSLTESTKILDDLQDVLHSSQHSARFVAAAAFRGMQGTWSLSRRITSRLAGFPSGSLQGTASLHPRQPTAEGYDAEYLYIESGKFKMEGTNFEATATRRYVYRYDAVGDKITAWFVKEDGKTVDYFFNEMVFEVPEEEQDNDDDDGRFDSSNFSRTGWKARGAHLCEKDMYKSRCEFRFKGAMLDAFGITYDVKGPKKDYTSESWYSPA